MMDKAGDGKPVPLNAGSRAMARDPALIRVAAMSNRGKYQGLPVMQRLLLQCEPVTFSGCWIWTGACNVWGYGQTYFQGRRQYAHRVMWQMLHGAIAPEMFVLHHCDVPCCVNPAHLYLGSLSDNARDRESRGRGRDNRGERSGKSILTEEQARRILVSHVPARALAKEYGVHIETIYTIRHRRSWRHL